MKQGMNIVDLAKEIQRQGESKRDYVADTRSLAVVPKDDGLKLEFDNGERKSLDIGDTAHGQIASRLNVPKKFYDRLRKDHPDLLAHNINELFNREPEKRMIRTLDGRARAFLSDRYRPLDNPEVFEAIFPTLRDLGVQIVSSCVTESRLYIKFLAPDIYVEAPDLLPPNSRPHGMMYGGEFSGIPASRLVAGGVIRNSEIGLGALDLSALNWWARCLNGMVGQKVLAQAHIGASTASGRDAEQFIKDDTRRLADLATFAKMRDVLEGMFQVERLAEWVAQARGAKASVIEDAGTVPQVVEVVGSRLALNEGTRKSVLSELITDGDLSQWGVANAVTRVARTVEDYDDASELEVVGGKVLELKKREWDTILSEAKRIAA